MYGLIPVQNLCGNSELKSEKIIQLDENKVINKCGKSI